MYLYSLLYLSQGDRFKHTMIVVHWSLIIICIVSLFLIGAILTVLKILIEDTRQDIYHSPDGNAYILTDV